MTVAEAVEGSAAVLGSLDGGHGAGLDLRAGDLTGCGVRQGYVAGLVGAARCGSSRPLSFRLSGGHGCHLPLQASSCSDGAGQEGIVGPSQAAV